MKIKFLKCGNINVARITVLLPNPSFDGYFLFQQSLAGPPPVFVFCFLAETDMFGARVVRQKRERERADRNLNDLDRKQQQSHSQSRYFLRYFPILTSMKNLIDWVTGLFKDRSSLTSNLLERDLIPVNYLTSNTEEPSPSWRLNAGFILRYFVRSIPVMVGGW